MSALLLESSPACDPLHALPGLVREPESPWAVRGLTDLVPPATLAEARERRRELVDLLGRERAAAADFLLALADFDRRRGWERLGHASLFSFLTRELGLSSGAAQLRLSAARLLPRHPAVEEALRGGRLCISAVGQLARVLTPENEAAVLPRFFGRSAREALEVAAALLPDPCPPRREVVTRLPLVAAPPETACVPPPAASAGPPRSHPAPPPAADPTPATTARPLHTHEVTPPRPPPRTPEVEPLSEELRRLHLTVSRAFLGKLAAARAGLSHALPGATTEQVLEAALDLLLEQQASRKALVRRPRRSPASPDRPVPPPGSGVEVGQASQATPETTARPRPRVPASVERAVRLRDGDRCQHPLDAGGVCGSAWQLELDHVVPVALGGPSTVENLRCACRRHNALAAELALGRATMAATRPRRGGRTGGR